MVNGDQWGLMEYPLVISYIAIENGPFIVDVPYLPIKMMVIFYSCVSLPEGNRLDA